MQTTVQRGRVLRDTNAGPGLLTCEGIQYVFTLEGMWRSDMPPRTGMMVEVTFDPAGLPVAVRLVPEAQLAREHAEQALAGVRRQGSVLAGTFKTRFAVPVLVAEVVMLLGFFVLPAVTISFVERSLSGWDAIGIDVNTMGANDHGLLSLLAIVGLFAPMAVPFVQKRWARWLYCGPLAFSVIALVTLYLQISSATRAVSRSVGDAFGSQAGQFANEAVHGVTSMYHVSVGVFVVLLCAGYLASWSFKDQSR